MTTPCSALYVHVPFCRSLCGYCDFYSEVVDAGRVTPLIDALLAELAGHAARRPLALETIYVGGGTPTVLPEPVLRRLLGELRRYLTPSDRLEFTVEANPATVTPAIAAALRDCGVNRVSIGAQSFVPVELAVLQRTHTPADVADTLAACGRAGLKNLSLDLIYGIPGQTLASWRHTLDAALSLVPTHISCYGLTYEPDTPLHAAREAGRIQPIDADLEADMYEEAMDRLPAAGLPQYEISNFACPGAECRHNLRYWHNQSYVGVGPSAAGFLDGVRYRNVADTAAYVAAIVAGRSPWSEQECLPPDRSAGETAMLALRLCAGIGRREFAARFGADPEVRFAEAVKKHVAGGLVEVTADTVRLTRAGRLLANMVMADFL